jgi:hypothetical protein
VQRQLLCGLPFQALIIDRRGLANAPQPVVKSIVLIRRGQVIQGKVEPPEKDFLIGLLLDKFIQFPLFKIPVLCFNFVTVQQVFFFRNIFGRPA